MKKYLIGAIAALSLSTAAYAAMHTVQERNDVIEICHIMYSNNTVAASAKLIRDSNLDAESKDYIYDMCYAYLKGMQYQHEVEGLI